MLSLVRIWTLNRLERQFSEPWGQQGSRFSYFTIALPYPAARAGAEELPRPDGVVAGHAGNVLDPPALPIAALKLQLPVARAPDS